MKKYLFALPLLLVSSLSLAETWNIGRYLSVSPPEDMDLTYQIFEDYDPKEKIVMGWTGEDLNYLLVVDEAPGGSKTSLYWKGLGQELKNGSDDKKIKTLKKGEYTSNKGVAITYRIYSWLGDGETNIQIYSLIKNKKIAYWVIASPTDNDKYVNVSDDTIKIMSTAILLK